MRDERFNYEVSIKLKRGFQLYKDKYIKIKFLPTDMLRIVIIHLIEEEPTSREIIEFKIKTIFNCSNSYENIQQEIEKLISMGNIQEEIEENSRTGILYINKNII